MRLRADLSPTEPLASIQEQAAGSISLASLLLFKLIVSQGEQLGYALQCQGLGLLAQLIPASSPSFHIESSHSCFYDSAPP